MSIARFSVNRPVTVLMIFLGLFTFGLASLPQIGQEMFPNIGLPTIAVFTVSPGVGPYDIESNITKPVESAVAKINGVETIEANCFESVSQVTIRFANGQDMNKASADVREAVTTVESQFPDGTQRSRILIFSASLLPSLRMNIATGTEGLDLRRQLEDKLVPELERVPGVAQVTLFGGEKSALTVKVHLGELSSVGIPLMGLLQAFKGENVSLPGGTIRADASNISLRTIGEFQSVEEVGRVIIGAKGDNPIFLSDVADIQLERLPADEFVQSGGKSAIRLNVQKQSGYNTVKVNEEVLRRMEKAKALLPPSVRFEIIEDQAAQVRAAIDGVASAAWEGAWLAILIILFFLRNLRSTLIVTLTIPISVVSTFVFMAFNHMTMNLTSLMGLTLAIGMIVDDAIVVIESIYRKLLVGLPPLEAAVQGTEEVASAVIASTLTTLAVFVPLLFVDGMAGILFRDLALTLIISMAVSLLSAMTLVPVLASRVLKVVPLAKQNIEPGQLDDISLADLEVVTGWKPLDFVAKQIQNALQWMDGGYARLSAWALDHVKWVIAGAVGLLVGSFALVVLLGIEFLPETDDAFFIVNFETRMGTTYNTTRGLANDLEKLIREEVGAELKSISSTVGDGGSHLGALSVILVPKDERKENIWAITNRLDRKIRQTVLDLRFGIVLQGMASLATQATGVSSPIVIRLAGDDIEAMFSYAQKIKAIAEKTPGTRSFKISHQVGKPEVQIRIKREEAVSLGLSPLEVAASVRTAYSGSKVSTYRNKDQDYDVTLMLADEDRITVDQIRQLFFVTSKGKKISLESVASIEEALGPVSISRKNRTRTIEVAGSLSGTVPLATVSAEVQKRVEDGGAPPIGVTRAFTGTGGELSSSFASLGLALMAALALVYMIMAAQFENLRNPLIIMFSIPFAVIGLVLALLFTNTTFNILSFTGAIMLAGIVVKNAIVLIDYIGHLQKQGVPLRQAIIHGGKTRLKPILMTTGATVLGMIPMALAYGTGAELRAPMARAIIGGLLTSTAITLILIPTILWMFEKRKAKKKPEILPADLLPALETKS